MPGRRKKLDNLCQDPAIQRGDLIFFTDRSKHTSHVALCHKWANKDGTNAPWIIHAAYGKKTCEVTEGPLKKYEGVEYIVVRPRAKVLGQNVINKMIEIAQNWLTTPFDTNRYEAYTEYCEQTKPFTTEQAGNEFKKNKKAFNKNKGYYRAIKFAARFIKDPKRAIYHPDKSKGFICFHFIISLIQTAIVLEEFGYAFNKKVCSGAWPSRKKINPSTYHKFSSSPGRFLTLAPDYIKNNTELKTGKEALPAPCFIHSDNLNKIKAIQRKLNNLIGIDALAHMTPGLLLLHLTEFNPNGPDGGANSSGPFTFVKHINPSAKRKKTPSTKTISTHKRIHPSEHRLCRRTNP